MSRLFLYCLHHQMTVAVLECRGSDWLLKLKNIFQKSHLVWVPNILSSNSPPGLHSPDASVLCCCFRIARSLGLWRLRACRPASASEASLPSSTFVAGILIHFRNIAFPRSPQISTTPRLHIWVNTFKHSLPAPLQRLPFLREVSFIPRPWRLLSALVPDSLVARHLVSSCLGSGTSRALSYALAICSRGICHVISKNGVTRSAVPVSVKD